MQTPKSFGPPPFRPVGKEPLSLKWIAFESAPDVAAQPDLFTLGDESGWASDDSSSTARPTPRTPTTPSSHRSRSSSPPAPRLDEPSALLPPPPDDVLEKELLNAFDSLEQTLADDWPEMADWLKGLAKDDAGPHTEKTRADVIELLRVCAQLHCLGMRGEQPSYAFVWLTGIDNTLDDLVDLRQHQYTVEHLDDFGRAVADAVARTGSTTMANLVGEAAVQQLKEELWRSSNARIRPRSLRDNVEHALLRAVMRAGPKPWVLDPFYESPPPSIESVLKVLDKKTSFERLSRRIGRIRASVLPTEHTLAAD